MPVFFSVAYAVDDPGASGNVGEIIVNKATNAPTDRTHFSKQFNVCHCKMPI